MGGNSGRNSIPSLSWAGEYTSLSFCLPLHVQIISFIKYIILSPQAQLQKKSSSEGKEVMQKLVGWTLQCLSLDTARQMPIAVSIS